MIKLSEESLREPLNVAEAISALQVNIAEAAGFQETLDNGGELCAGTADALFNIDAWAAQNLTEEIKVLIGKTDEQLVPTFRSSCAGACKGFAHRLIRQWLADFSIDGGRTRRWQQWGNADDLAGCRRLFPSPGHPSQPPGGLRSTGCRWHGAGQKWGPWAGRCRQGRCRGIPDRGNAHRI